MIKKVLAVIAIILMTAGVCQATEIAGVKLSDSLEFGQAKLMLNGAGVRTKYLLKLYVGCLYLKEKSQDAKYATEADESMAIRLHIISSMVTSERMEETVREGFVNSMNGNTAPLQDKIEKFISIWKEKIKIGDTYDLVYVPGKGTKVYKNGKFYLVTEGLPFKQALFGIWFCNKPAQKSLKKEMLGQ